MVREFPSGHSSGIRLRQQLPRLGMHACLGTVPSIRSHDNDTTRTETSCMHVRVAKRSTYVAHRNARNSILGHWWAHWRSRSRVQILRGSHHLPRCSARADRVLVDPPIPRHRARIPGLGIGSRHGCTVGVGGGSGGDIDMGFCTCCRILCEQRQVRRVKEQVCRRKVGRASSLGDTHVSVVHRERVTSTHTSRINVTVACFHPSLRNGRYPPAIR